MLRNSANARFCFSFWLFGFLLVCIWFLFGLETHTHTNTRTHAVLYLQSTLSLDPVTFALKVMVVNHQAVVSAEETEMASLLHTDTQTHNDTRDKRFRLLISVVFLGGEWILIMLLRKHLTSLAAPDRPPTPPTLLILVLKVHSEALLPIETLFAFPSQ